MAKHLVLTFRRENDGSLRCSSPKDAPMLHDTLEEILADGYSVETMVQGREDEHFDLFLLARS